MLAENAKACVESAAGSIAKTIGAWPAISTTWDWINGACKEDMFWQQSWLASWECCGQGMLSQHCIASSGVEAAKQSSEYNARPATNATAKMARIRRIVKRVHAE